MNAGIRYAIILWLAILTNGFAQVDHFQSFYFSISPGYLAVKDQLNYGFVFRGPELKFDFGYRQSNPEHYFDIHLSAKVVGYTTNGMWGGGLHFTPFSISRLFSVLKKEEYTLFIGPSLHSNYQFNLFWDIRSGHMSWMTNYSLGLKSLVTTSFRKKRLEISFENSLLNSVSRPDLEIEPYWYSMKFSDWLSSSHENMSVGSFNVFNFSKLQAALFFAGKKRRHAISYSWQYLLYPGTPKYQQFNHTLSYRWYLKKLR